MNRAVFFAIFLLVFFALFGIMNFYGIARTASLFGARSSLWAVPVALLIGVLFIVSTMVARQASLPARALYLVAATWAGIIFLLACVLLLHELLRLFVTLPDATWGLLVVGTTFALSIVAFVLGNTVVGRELTIESPKLTKELRIVQISDTHLGAIHGERHLERIVRKVRALGPDAVVITGDLIDGSGNFDPALFSLLDRFGAPTFFVTGNHEIYSGEGYIDTLLNRTKVRHLKDEKVSFRGIDLIGIDDCEERGAAARKLASLKPDPERFSLVLYHQPSGARTMRGVDLILAGHTHNGQIVPFNLLSALLERPVTGLHARKDGGMIYVSPGTGTWGPPMRLGSVNTVTFVKLVPAD